MTRRSAQRWTLTLLALIATQTAPVEMHESEGVPRRPALAIEARGNSIEAFPSIARWRHLRYGTDSESRLPERSTMLSFSTPSAWDAYRWPIFGVLSVVAMQALLVGWLLAGRRRRAEASVEAHRLEARTQLMMIAHLHRRVAVGELTAGIAHELNQPLEAILHNAEAGEMLLESGNMSCEEMRNILADIRRIDTRAALIIQRLRGLLRKKEELDARPLDVNELAREAVELVSPVASSNGVYVKLDLATVVGPVSGDQIHLQQVLLNVMLNGIEAMNTTPRERRHLAIRTANVDHQVEISIKDCGLGIRAKAVSDIFDPFYTTKGAGMGIGLSIARQIVAAHGGQIAARNNPDGGATVWFALPLDRGAVPTTTVLQ